MIIKNGWIFNREGKFIKADIAFGEKIIGIGEMPGGGEAIDAEGCYVIPGLVDTHMHGAVGENFLDYGCETAEKICRFEAENGTTTLVPALSAAEKAAMKRSVRYVAEASGRWTPGCAKIMGIHLEGPFLSKAYRGSMLPEAIRSPDIQEFEELYEAGNGLIKIVTIAPELENGYGTVAYMADKGVTVSIGHSGATFEEAQRAFSRGALQTTHTFNAMSPLHHREPGVVGAAVCNDLIRCELICDFFHVHQDVAKLLYRMKGADRITMITDSEVGTGLPDGRFTVYGKKITVKERKTYMEDGTIFGGSTVLLDGVRNLVSIGIPLEDTIKMAAQNGATAAGIDDRVGSLAEGKDADIVILDQELNVRQVIVNGRPL